MKNRILITGIAGFLGSNLCSKLIEEGYDVYGVDNMSTGHIEFLPLYFNQNRLIISDFSDDIILNKIKNYHYDIVIHLAAMPRVLYSIECPYETNENNVSKTVKLLDACRGNVKRFINISSSSVYGNAEIIPTPETTIHNPQSPYALQKSIIEKYCNLFSTLYDMDTVSIRPFNIFGPNQMGDSAYATAVSAWFSAIKSGQPLRSDGTGEQTRDMVYVDNVVDLIIRCINYEKFRGEAFNAGTGFSVSNNEILNWFKNNFMNCKIINAPARIGDVMKTCADISLSQNVLEYTPIVNFWEGLELTRKWTGI
jgi:nucleoside-diphosphate-sugar epimerase